MSSPWNDRLPVSVEVGGAEYEIRSDYRAVLDICAALSDPELDGGEKTLAALDIFYPCLEGMPPEHYQEAVEACFRFINCGEEETPEKSPRLVDWEKDFRLIVAPVNRVCGCEVRAVEYMHWWTFLAAYMEIGDCTFAQVVNIRNKQAQGKPLDKQEREFYRKNRRIVDLERHYTKEENDLLKRWG